MRITRRGTVLSGCAVLAAGGVAAIAASLTAGPPPAATAAPPPVTAAPSPTASAAPAPPEPLPTEELQPTPEPTPTPLRSSSVHLVVDEVGLDLPVLPTTPRGGVINPPTLREAYWIEPYGEPGPDADNTVYIAAHSWSGGDAAFNPLMDVADRRSAVQPGDDVEVSTPSGTTRYTVTSAERYAKGALPGASEVWEAHPGRLVLITCFQHDDGRASTENLVITAEAD